MAQPIDGDPGGGGILIDGGDQPTIAYDANGNLIHYKEWNYRYDAQNRLTEAWNGTTTAQFYYDGKNRQIARNINGVVRFSSWDGWELLEEYASGLTVAKGYLQGATGIIKSWDPIYGQLYYYQDKLGSTTHVANALGQLVESYKYDLYGTPSYFSSTSQPINSSTLGVADLYAGERYIPELRLYDLRNRFMSPELGRFLQPDPIGFKGDASNLYRYCGNDPVDRSDPTGLIALDTSSSIWNRLKLFDTANPDPTSLSELNTKISDTARFYDSVRALTETSRRDARNVDPATMGRALVKDAQAAGGDTAGDIHSGKGINSGQERTYAEYAKGRSLNRKGPRLGKSYANTGRQADIPGYVEGGSKPITVSHSHGPGSPRGFDNFDIPSADGGSFLRTPYISSLQHYLDHTKEGGGPVMIYVPGGGQFRSSDGETFSFIR